MTALDLSNYAGLTTLGLLTANIALGLLISTKYNPVRSWPHRRIDTVGLHNWTGYAALAVAFLHPVLLLFSATAKFGVIDLLWPLGGPKQPVVNAFGAAAFYLLVVVVGTSILWQERRAISRTAWKRVHFSTYAMYPLYAVHSILTDPALKDRPIDPFDAEKVFVELCVLAVAFGIVLRVRWQRRQPPPRAHRPKGARPPVTTGDSGTATIGKVALLLVVAVAAAGIGPSTATGQASPNVMPAPKQGWSYNPDVGAVYRRGDLTYATWAFAERYWGPHSAAVPADYWRRARQGMELDLPRVRVPGVVAGVRPVLVYEIDATDNNFFRAGRRSQVFENAYVAVQHADDPGRGRVLFGENTHVLSREDNLSSGNLPTINRSLVLEEHGSVNSFGTQWGVQASRALTPRLALAVSAQDNRGSLNTASPRYAIGNSVAAKFTAVALDAAARGRRLTVGVGADYTRDIQDRTFTFASAVGGEALGGAVATGDKLTLESDVAYTATAGGRAFTLEAEGLASGFSRSGTDVVGGYAQLQVSAFDAPSRGDLDPFLRYDMVWLDRQSTDGAAIQHALRAGVNYNLLRTGKFASVHAEYALNRISGPTAYVPGGARAFGEFRIGLRVNAARYARR